MQHTTKRFYLSLFLLLIMAFGIALPSLVFGQTVPENCSNGIDDDGDGLIDCFDPDCNCTQGCAGFYYAECEEDCFYVPPCDTVVLGVDWTATAETGSYSSIVAGDLDGDGFPEVVTSRAEGNQLYIIDGRDGSTKVTINCPAIFRGGTSPAIADLDNDGLGEIVIVAEDRRLRCYAHDGTQEWISTALVGYSNAYSFSNPSIADFDGNGNPEICIGNQVFNGQTGALIGGAGSFFSAGEHPKRKAIGFSFNSSVAMDVLPDNACADCAGLEIVAGNQVFSVNIAAGRVIMRGFAPLGYSDGFTAVVDFDRDGDLDAVVQGTKNGWNTTYVWDIQTSTVLREFRLANDWQEGASRPNVADLDGDGQLEVSFVGYPWFYALDNNFSLLWRNLNSDVSSVTCSSVFDFCGDGSADIIYRGQDNLIVYEGATGAIKWQDACISATHVENPLVLDVDKDGQTEIVIICGNTAGEGTVLAYEATNTAAIATRSVWNQHAYFSTNINDDLSVPRVQQSPHLVGDGLVLNGFMNQYFNPTFPSADAEISVISTQCALDSMRVSFDICNKGAAILPRNTPVSAYLGNPTTENALWLGMRPLGFDLAMDSCRSFSVTLPRFANDSVFIVLNDNHGLTTPFNLADDFPTSGIGECNFENNMAGLYLAYNPDQLNLGPDTLICHSAQLSLNASGRDFVAFLWENTSTDSIRTGLSIGQYAVTVTDVCGLTQTDSRRIAFDSATIVQLGADRSLCAGDSVVLSQSGFNSYVWSPSTFVDCPVCPSISAFPGTSSSVILEARLDNGCFSRDTLALTVYPIFDKKIDTTVCYGLQVQKDGIFLSPGESRVFSYQSENGCDSLVTLQVFGTDLGTYQHQVDTAVCLGSGLNLHGETLYSGDFQAFNFTARTGCDSTVTYFVAPLDTFYTVEKRQICAGDSSNIFGSLQTLSGFYPMVFSANNGCDSTHVIELFVMPSLEIAMNATETCLNGKTGVLEAFVSGGTPPYRYAWTPPAADVPRLENLPTGSFNLTVTDIEGCTREEVGAVAAFPNIPYSVVVDSVRCFGENNGAIRILSNQQSDLLTALGTSGLSQTYTFEDLLPGSYPLRIQDINGCEDSLVVRVQQPDSLVLEVLGENSIKLGEKTTLETISNLPSDELTYSWSPAAFLSCADCPNPEVQSSRGMVFSVVASNSHGCSAEANIQVLVERIVDIFVPNVINPEDATDENTRLQPYFGPAIERVEAFRVFDRWGSLLHEVTDREPQDRSLAWMGLTKEKINQPAVYAWQLVVTLVDGSSETHWGDVSVVR